MRLGKYWNYDAIDEKTKDRINKILTGEYDAKIKDRVREKTMKLTVTNDFQGLQLWLAQYIVYNRHSEIAVAGKWNSVDDLEKYLKEFKQHELRNPIVEQVIIETLRVVRDIWKHYGQGAKDFFNEIHVELGREMKNTAEERKHLTDVATENENANLRIKALIMELNEDAGIENVRPHSSVQQEILKIYEDDVMKSGIEVPDEILKISKTAQPSKSELQRYKLWLEQKYQSPYTGEIIPLGKLFTAEYEIEHIIPRSRYFDDSLNNKVICEAVVNKLKNNQLGMEFIQSRHGEEIERGMKILSTDAYKEFVKEHYKYNNKKRNNLLLEDIPEKMIARQMNDTRYISKFISHLLSNIVRADKDDDGVNSKNLVPVTGKITATLRQDWGLNDVWNDLILPRFERMNALANTTVFTVYNERHQKFLPTVPLNLSKGFQKKRIDHRHHAMDALIIACATCNHVNLSNNQHAKTNNFRYDLQCKLRRTEKWIDKEGEARDKFVEFKKPWESFTVDARDKLEKIAVSFKQNLRIINKASNKYEKISAGKKIKVRQEGVNWAIRKPLHKDTFFGKITLRKIRKVQIGEALKDWTMIVNKELKAAIKQLVAQYGKFDIAIIGKYFKDRKYLFNNTDISKVDIYYFETDKAATRKALDTSFNAKTIESVTDTDIQKILLRHLENKNNNSELAFSPEGIEEMNKNIAELNGGKSHQPIYKVRVYELMGNKFQVGYAGNKKAKYVEAAKGTNLFFGIYADENGNRSYETIPLNIVIERMKQGLNAVPERNEKGHNLLFRLSPHDLVYVPAEEEKANINAIDWGNLSKEQVNRIFVVNDFSNACYFTPNRLAKNIAPKEVDLKFDAIKNKASGSFDTKTASFEGKQIKDVCIKLNIDRLGNITI
jgi:CRISPR-associated endonuclease Csn1